MASIPYSILLTQKQNVLPISTIQEHQKFCKKFQKAHQTFEKYKNNPNSKLIFISDNVFLFNQKKQKQADILNWFNTLPEEEKLSILSIKNKWLVNIFTQLFFIYYKMGNYSYKPLSDMCFFFEDQKNYLSREQKDNSFNSLFELLESKNIKINQSIKEEKSKNNNNEENEYLYDDLNLYSNFFESNEIIDNNYLKSEKREYETKFIENIRVICSEKDNFDTITFKKEFIMNIDTIKKFMEYFSGENFFRDWIIPVNAKNIYNFVLPYWMHDNKELSLCQLIIGYFEQKILVNYEYNFYTKKNYEFSYNKQISELYKENQELVKFVQNNYSYNKNNKNKEEILTLKKITKVVDDLRGNENFIKKNKLTKDIFNKICEEKPCYRGKEILFNDELSLEVYNSLNKELSSEKDNYIQKLIDLITFVSFLDIINFKENIYYGFRKIIIDSQCDLVLDELQSEGFLHKKSNKKHKKKKKKDNSGNNNIKENDKNNQNNKKPNNPPIKINIYDVQTKEIECEYNMNSRSQQFNMIQENASNVSISSSNNPNNFFIIGSKKSEEKKPEKVEIPKKEEKVKILEKTEKKEEKNNKIENKKIEIKNEEKKEIKNIKEEKEEKEKEKEEEKEEKEKTKEKNKNKDFFLYPIKKKKKDNNNINAINDIKETKETKEKTKNNKHKKQKNNNLKEDNKQTQNKNSKFNFVQERKNNVQINPCPRRKKKVPFQTSSINFEMRMKPSFDSYPYYYSFPMMKPFTTLSEVSTKFSMPSTIKKNTKENKNNKNSISDNSQKSHWDYTQYNNNNYNNALQIFNSFTPSEKYFESLNKELNNYLAVTNTNISNLKNIYQEHLEKIENLIQNGLSEKYEIKFGHYGSFFSNLSIEGSDIDILVYYHKKTDDCDFDKDILNLLDQNENVFENTCPILTASVPVIKLKIDITNEIKEKDIKLKNTSYFEEEDLTKINIDLTFTENEKDFQHSNDIVSYINKSLEEYPQIKPILLLIKRYFKEMNMNKSYTGGLCSYSLFLLVLSFCKNNKQCENESVTKLLFYFMENFTYFDYANYCIDVEKENCYILKDKNDNMNEKSASDENSSYDTNYEVYDKEIHIIDPISKLNVSKSSFKVDEIILTFRKAFNLLYYEGWYYDLNSTNKINDTKIIDNVSELYEDDSLDYMTIKKLFDLKSLRNNFDFYFN